jgi:hypothetical protein
MRRLVLICLVLCVALGTFAQKKKKPEVPQAVVVAQFVYITSFNGGIYDSRTSYAERQALSATEEAVRSWGRYKVVYHPEEADIMLIVKPSGMANTRIGVGTPPLGGIQIGGRPDPRDPGGVGIGSGGEASSSPDDTLLVSMRPNDEPAQASFVWRRSARNGLQGKKPALIDQLKKDVEEAEELNKKKP